MTCLGCGAPLREWRGLNSCDTADCPGNLRPTPEQDGAQALVVLVAVRVIVAEQMRVLAEQIKAKARARVTWHGR